MAVVDFGRDTSCTDSLRTGRFVTGNRLVAEALWRRLNTPRGDLRGGEAEANYGIDLPGMIGSVNTESDKAALPGRISAECAKDERVLSVNATILSTTAGPAVTFTIAINVVTALGPFTMKISVNEVSVDLLGYQEAA